jgi:sensor histidine kinase YesM
VQRDATEARLKLLEAQLAPHMLFNTLANLRALITLEPARAVAMLDHLDSYLRAVLTGSRELSHPLAAEFARLADYLELMSVRMGPRLRYELVLPAALRNVRLPPLLLQPLVENAIRHGLEPLVEGGAIEVCAHREGSLLLIDVKDTGTGFDDGARPVGTGFGLAQVRERLQSLYGERAELAVTASPGGGTLATLRLPL